MILGLGVSLAVTRSRTEFFIVGCATMIPLVLSRKLRQAALHSLLVPVYILFFEHFEKARWS
jgi:Na+-translocating ferredoxin:NAD+ oxidoreductase RnfE subunit